VRRGYRTTHREIHVSATFPSSPPARPADRTSRPSPRLLRCRPRRALPSKNSARSPPPASCWDGQAIGQAQVAEWADTRGQSSRAWRSASGSSRGGWRPGRRWHPSWTTPERSTTPGRGRPGVLRPERGDGRRSSGCVAARGRHSCRFAAQPWWSGCHCNSISGMLL